ncbi:MAG: hypothetical protein H0W89_01115 [Candidatus Levybacteria bacterium]|nr:hypothetical protein [Candidatus Levybacteria bacterium]
MHFEKESLSGVIRTKTDKTSLGSNLVLFDSRDTPPRAQFGSPKDKLGIFNFLNTGDISTSRLMPDYVVFDECPENERNRYISLVKHFNPSPTMEDDYVAKGGFFPANHGLLQQIRIADRITHASSYIQGALDLFDKSSIAQIIAKEIGHRPQATVFHPAATDGRLPDDILSMVDDTGAVYLKQDKSAKANRVIRIAKAEEGYTIQDLSGEETVPSLQTFSVPTSDAFTDYSIPWTAEEQISVARTNNGESWEVRLLPPFKMQYPFAKVGNADAHVNNIAQGGSVHDALSIVQNAILAKDPNMSVGEAQHKARAFLQEGYDIATDVKALTDAMHITLAKKIIRPEDVKDPDQYDNVMRDAFGGTFYCVDVTGVWDEETKSLKPMIIEAQAEAGMPDTMMRDLYPMVIEETKRKRRVIQSALK